MTEDPIVWTDKNGKQMHMFEISDEHLLNIISFLQRHHIDKLSEDYRSMSLLRGEAALDAIENTISETEREYQSRIQVFYNEARIRELM